MLYVGFSVQHRHNVPLREVVGALSVRVRIRVECNYINIDAHHS